jgi:hypothetical protein
LELSTQNLKNLGNPNKKPRNPNKKINKFFLNKTRKSKQKSRKPNKKKNRIFCLDFRDFCLDFRIFCLDFHIFFIWISGIRQNKNKKKFLFGFPRHPNLTPIDCRQLKIRTKSRIFYFFSCFFDKTLLSKKRRIIVFD